MKQIYAIGFRNPFRLAFTPNDKLLAADVGEASWEELNVVTRAANYGWPAQEGSCTGCEYINPIYAYQHSGPPANAGSITAVMVYSGGSLPANYRNKVYIADYSVGWIKELEFDTEFTSLISERMLDSQAGTTVKLAQGPDGNIYQLNIYPGRLSVIAPSGGNRAPTAAITASATYGLGDSLDVQFSAAGSSDPEGDDLTYQWNFGNGQTSTEETPTITFTNTGEYAAYTVTLTVSDGEEVSTATQRIVVGSTPPTAEIAVSDGMYDAGDTISFSATGFDDQDGALPASAYKWTVVFHHADHVHPFQDNVVGPTGQHHDPTHPRPTRQYVLPDNAHRHRQQWPVDGEVRRRQTEPGHDSPSMPAIPMRRTPSTANRTKGSTPSRRSSACNAYSTPRHRNSSGMDNWCFRVGRTEERKITPSSPPVPTPATRSPITWFRRRSAR